MTHLVDHRFGDVLDRAVKVLSAQIEFVYTFVVFAFFPNLLFRPPTVSLVARIDLNRNNGFHKFATEQMLVDEVVQFSEISDSFDIPFRSVFQFRYVLYIKNVSKWMFPTFDTRVKLYGKIFLKKVVEKSLTYGENMVSFETYFFCGSKEKYNPKNRI